MKLTFCYSTFNGLELLVNSVNNILPCVDNVLICHQTISNLGNLHDNNNVDILNYLAKKSNVKIIYFFPDLEKSTKQNERDKHNFMIYHSRKLETTHFIMGACDHFYKREEVEFAKKFVIENDIDVSLTAMYTYYKTPNFRLYPIEDYYMPFICKLQKETKIEAGKYQFKVDPSVMVFPFNKMHLFDNNDVMLHHYSMLRNDIVDKFTNAAASIRWTPNQVMQFIDEFENAKEGDLISYFQNRKLVKCESIFDAL